MPPPAARVDTSLPTVRRAGEKARRPGGPIPLAFVRQLVYEHVVLGLRASP
jgi:hypothetical protein